MDDLIKNKNIKKKKITTIISIVSTIIILLGSVYAFFTYYKSAEAFTLTSNSITATFTGGTNQINFTNAYPISDEYALANLDKLDYIDFTVIGNSNEAITYEIFLTEANGNTLSNQFIKTYVTDNNGNKLTDPTIYGNLTNTTYTNEPNGKVVLKRTYASSFTKSYRLYIWLDKDYEQNTLSQNFSFYVNIYAYNDTSSKAVVNITFDANGGTVSPGTLQGTFDAVTGFPRPTREGYTFNGWYDSNDNQVTEATVDGGATTLHATWNKNKYNLVVQPNSGVWETHTANQTYILDYEEEKTISNPTKTGYTFTGWTKTGNSSTLTGTTFKMGGEDATLKANYSINTYTLTINPNGGTWNNSTTNQTFNIQYNGIKTINNPTKTGYTFTGWTINGEGSALSGSTFKMGSENATLTANFTINDYKWIVYHNKMNVSGNGYTLFESETGHGNYGTTFQGTLKNYTGFTNPTRTSKTIEEDIKYGSNGTPTNNVLNYNYSRNRYNLIVNPNNGTYNNTTSNTTTSMYYEASTTISNPTRTCYTFNNWSKTGSGTIDGTTFTQGAGETTLTANWTITQYTITYNANGGSVTPGTETANCGESITLPTPTRVGYSFNGWYTAASGGTLVGAAGASYTPTESKEIFAQWTLDNITINSFTITNSTIRVHETTTTSRTFTGTPSDISYSSNNSSVAEVDGNGVITGKKGGTATITLTLSYYDENEPPETATVTVTVSPLNAANVNYTSPTGITCKSGNNNVDCDSVQLMIEKIDEMLD